MKIFSIILLAALGFALVPTGGVLAAPPAVESATMFPFVIPWDDAARTATDVSFLNPAPLDGTRRIETRQGHFFDATGRRVRFLGVNFTFNANFPEKADAEKIAARLHKYGFNIVRLHHMDAYHAPRGIWDAAFPDTQHLDAAQLDRLDYLVAQLKKNGIYVNLNLHVSRALGGADGFAETEKLPRQGKVVSYFEPRMIELQKNFARDLLTHINPYTQMRWADDPAVALVEINNEDSLLSAARSGQINDLPPTYRNQLLSRWNVWLQKKYANTAGVLAAWNKDSQPPGKNLLLNADFLDGQNAWKLETQPNTPTQISIEDATEKPNSAQPPGNALHLNIERVSGTPWHLQLHQNALDLAPGEYTLSFWAKADQTRILEMASGTDQAPWRRTGLATKFSVTTQWQKFKTVGRIAQPVPGHSRLSFVLGNAAGNLWLAGIELRAGAVFEADAGQSPENKTLENKNLDFPVLAPNNPGADYAAFLMEIETDYAREMRSFVRQTLGAKSLVTCSQASFGGLSGVWRESAMDFVDMHAYWEHPKFPNKSWDPVDWNIPNTSMVRDVNAGTLSTLAMHRVAGKPFTVSEYNHPAPNDYSAEGWPMLAAVGALQDWDGLFLFEYSGDRTQWNSNRIKGFFSADSHPGKMAFAPAAALLFLRADFKPQSKTQTLVLSQKSLPHLAAQYVQDWGGGMHELWKSQQIERSQSLNTQLAVRFTEGSAPPHITQDGSTPATNAAGQNLAWKAQPAERALFSAVSPATQVVAGFAGGGSTQAGDLLVAIQPSARNFCVLTLNALNGALTREATSLLLTVAGEVSNAGMTWNAERTSVGRNWGQGPTLAEGIAADVSLKTTLRLAKVWALDGTGARVREIPSELKLGMLTFAIGPQFQTLWYEIEGEK